jgi:hypothetical protein
VNWTVRQLLKDWGDFKVLLRQAAEEGAFKNIGLYGDVYQLYLQNISGILKLRNADDTDYVDLAAKAGTFNARLKALVDLLVADSVLLKYDSGLKFRNAADTDYADLLAKAGTFSSRLAAYDALIGSTILLKYSGGVLTLRNAADTAYQSLGLDILSAQTKVLTDLITERTGGAGVSFDKRIKAAVDLLVGSKVLLKPYGTGNVLLVRKADDSGDADINAASGYFGTQVKANTILPNTGNVITLGTDEHRVKIPNLTSETGLEDRHMYRYSSGGRTEFRIAMTQGASVVPKTLNMTTLLASYSGSVDLWRNLYSGWVAQTFKPAYDSEIGAVALKIKRSGVTTESVRMELHDVDTGTGKPTGAALAVSQAVSFDELMPSGANVVFRFSAPVSRSANQATAFVLVTVSGIGSLCFLVAVDNTSPGYADGQIAVGSGEGWTLYNEDASFFEVWSPTTGGASGGGGGAATDELVKVSGDDTTAGYLGGKLVAGTGISLTELNGGADEDLQIAHAQVTSGDLHTEYQKESEKGIASGYCDLDASALVPLARIPATLTGKDADTVDTYHATSLEKTANKGVASGYASLDTNTKVVQDPANATATPTASKIPIAGGDGKLAAGWIPVASLYSIVDYVFAPDAAPGATITAGDQQGNIYHSGPSAETAIRLLVDAETAPGANGLPITVQYGDTNDLDTVTTWTTIATYTLSSEKSGYTDTMSNASIPSNRVIRMNIGTIAGTPKDASITLRCKRPLSM